MKYVMIIGDGMADDPLGALSGKTPLGICGKTQYRRIGVKRRGGQCEDRSGRIPARKPTRLLWGYSAAAPQNTIPAARRWKRPAQGISLSTGRRRLSLQ